MDALSFVSLIHTRPWTSAYTFLAMTIRGITCLAVLLLTFLPVSAQNVAPDLQVETVVTGLSLPTTMAFIGDDDILVLQKNNGQVRRVQGGVLLAGSVLDVGVSNSSERGLLGIATDPDFINNNHVYLYYTESSTGADGTSPVGNRVYRYTWDGSALVDPVLILDLPATPGPNHDGGVILFGPDDKLYVVIGDLNRNGQLENFPAGDPPDDTAVIFRVDVHGNGLADNPFFDTTDPSNPLNRYYAYGLRNSFGMGFDPVSGELWDTENGPTSFDEVNLVGRGFNSGWEQIMGPDSRDPQGEEDLWVVPGSAYSDPEFSWLVPVAPTAITFAESRIMGCDREHDAFVGDNNCGQIYQFELNASRDGFTFQTAGLQDLVADNSALTCKTEMDELIFGLVFGVITDIENGPDGRLYVVSLSAGAIYRIGPNPAEITDIDGDDVDDACDCDTSDGTAFAGPVEVPTLRLSGQAPTLLGWDPQTATAGSGTTYTVISGDLSDLTADGEFASACTLAIGLTTPAFSDLRDNPAAGEGFHYLVRAGNACDDGTYGNGSGLLDPRDLLDASTPPSCP